MSPSAIRPRALMGQGLALLLSLVAAGACGDDPTGPDPSPVGTYQLVQVGGEQLPFLIIRDGLAKMEITGGTLSLAADHTCDIEIEFTFTEVSGVSTSTGTATCTWTRDGNSLTLTYPDGDTDSGSWSQDTLTIRGLGQGATMTFQR